MLDSHKLAGWLPVLTRNILKEGIEFLRWKVLPSLGASNLVNIHRTESTLYISPAQKYLSFCWIKNLTRGCNIEEEKSSVSSVPSCHLKELCVMCMFQYRPGRWRCGS